MGGYANARYYNDVWYSEDGANWTRVTGSAGWSKRHSHTSISYDDKIWVMGGYDGTPYKNDIWYSTDGVSWTRATGSAGWTRRYSHTSISYDDKIWVMGGSHTSMGTDENDVWYSTDGVSWTQATASAGWSGRNDHVILVYDNKMWVMGGHIYGDSARYDDVWYSEDGIDWYDAEVDPPIVSSRISTSIVSGVIPNSMTLLYDAESTVNGNTYASLLSTFGVSRLDECLTEGQNFLRVTATDDTDARNATTFDLSTESRFINIDTSAPAFRLSGDAATVAESSDDAACFDSGITIDGLWTNYHPGGNLESVDVFKTGTGTASCGTCTTFTTEQVNCNTLTTISAHANAVWTLPSGVDPATGIFTAQMCNGEFPLYDANSSCVWGCSGDFARDESLDTCVPLPETVSYDPYGVVCDERYEYDEDTDTCTFITQEAVALGEGLFILMDDPTGKEVHAATLRDTPIDTNGSLMPAETCVTEMWSERFSYTGLEFDGKMWVMGGYGGGNVYSDVWYSEDGVTWTQATGSAPWNGRFGHQSLVYDDKMWVIGGYD